MDRNVLFRDTIDLENGETLPVLPDPPRLVESYALYVINGSDEPCKIQVTNYEYIPYPDGVDPGDGSEFNNVECVVYEATYAPQEASQVLISGLYLGNQSRFKIVECADTGFVGVVLREAK